MKRASAPASAFCAALLAALAGARAAAAAPADPADYYNPEDFSSEALYATGIVGVGARAMGLAGNYVGIADDATALVYNPAGLAQLLLLEVDFGLYHLDDDNTSSMFGVESTAGVSHTGIDHAAFAYPIPTYRGSLVAGFGVFRARSNDLGEARRDQRSGPDYRFDDDFQRAQRDGVYRYTGGFGFDVSRTLSVGGSLSYWEGQLRDDQYRRIDETVTGEIPLLYEDRMITEADVDGFNFDFGVMGYPAPGLRLGVVLRSPVWFDIEGGGEFVRDAVSGTESGYEALYIYQQPSGPWSLACGASLALGPALLAGDLRFAAWDEFDADAEPFAPGSPLPLASSGYGSTVGGGVGVEVAVPQTPLRLRGGFSYDPEPYQLLLGNPASMVHDRRTWSVGAGVQVAGTFLLDASYEAASFERQDTSYAAVGERREAQRFHVTAGYRY